MLIKHRIRKFIVLTVAIVCKPFKEQRVTKKPNKLNDWGAAVLITQNFDPA